MVDLWVSFSSSADPQRALVGVPRCLGGTVWDWILVLLTPVSQGQEGWLGGAKEGAVRDQGSYLSLLV